MMSCRLLSLCLLLVGLNIVASHILSEDVVPKSAREAGANTEYDNVGCYADNVADRAIPLLEGTDSRLDGIHQDRVDAIQKCAQVAHELGYTMFALQNGGGCRSGPDAQDNYDKYGPSNACLSDGGGGYGVNEVYTFTPVLAPPNDIEITTRPTNDEQLQEKIIVDEGSVCNDAPVRFEIFTIAMNFADAEAYCQDLGGHLARIPDEATSDRLYNEIIESGAGDVIGTGFWIGLNDLVEEGKFEWTRDGCVLGDFSNWVQKPKQPNNNTKKNVDGQDCVQLGKRYDFKWDDEYCDMVRDKGFVCEFLDE